MKFLELNLITPEFEEKYRIKYISLEDKLGSLGIYPKHDKYITELVRSVGHFETTEGEFYYIAYDHGFLKVEKDKVVILSRAIVVGKSVEEIREELRKKLTRISKLEVNLRKSIENLEREFLKRLAEIERFY